MKLYDHVHVQLRVSIMHGSHMDWKDGKTFSSQGIFEQTGTLPKLLEKWGHFGQFLFFSDFLIKLYLLNRCLYLLNTLNKIQKKYWKMEKYSKSRGRGSERFYHF